MEEASRRSDQGDFEAATFGGKWRDMSMGNPPDVTLKNLRKPWFGLMFCFNGWETDSLTVQNPGRFVDLSRKDW